jgi:aminomethyltransferase
MKRTAFLPLHQQLGAKLVEFAGFEMPVLYSGIIDEHKTVRQAVGMFDVSHMGEFLIRGSDALAFLQKVTTNDVAKLSPGKVQYSCMTYEDGGIVDDLLVYHLGDHYMTVVNASNMEKDLAWMRSQAAGLSVEVTDISDAVSLLAVQGPRSLETLQKLTGADLSAMAYYTSLRATLAGAEMIVSRTGYTGELGFELYFDAAPALGASVWHAVMEAGREFGIRPIGLGARDTLRLEMGFCLYGNDIDQTTNPLEAGLGWITKLAKGDFIGRAAILRAKEAGLARRLVGFTMDEAKAFPRHHYPIRLSGRSVGHVTSGTMSPVLERGIGMGYVESASAAPGTPVGIAIRQADVPAHVVTLPFLQR